VNVLRAERLGDSQRKIRAPFRLDETMRFYSPQENVEALAHPRVASWLAFVAQEWSPPSGGRRLALLLPCTKFKPYPVSREHRAINGALLAAGWMPDGPSGAPDDLEPSVDRALLHDGPLRRGDTVLDRFVVSEPLALVPYEHVYTWRGAPSPASAYDDPGLFESRGTSVSPERPDCTAVRGADGRWRWGPAEREAYAEMHDRLVGVLDIALTRLRPSYAAIAAWVSPGLTHRSFLADRALRRAEGIPAARRGLHGPRALTGVLDRSPGLVEVLPTRADLAHARARLAERLAREAPPAGPGAVRSVFARGDGGDTPLGLPETLVHLAGWLAVRS
jgi:hypothetical protein